MRVIVVGCGRVGSELALRASRAGHEVTVVDKQAAAFSRLALEFKGRLQEGDALSRSVLARAGVEDADALMAVTKDDSLNVVVGHIARSEFGIETVMVRNHEPQGLPLIEAFGLPVVSCGSWSVGEYLRGLAGETGQGES